MDTLLQACLRAVWQQKQSCNAGLTCCLNCSIAGSIGLVHCYRSCSGTRLVFRRVWHYVSLLLQQRIFDCHRQTGDNMRFDNQWRMFVYTDLNKDSQHNSQCNIQATKKFCIHIFLLSCSCENPTGIICMTTSARETPMLIVLVYVARLMHEASFGRDVIKHERAPIIKKNPTKLNCALWTPCMDCRENGISLYRPRVLDG